MQDQRCLQYYGIEKNSSIIISLKLQGDSVGSNIPKGPRLAKGKTNGSMSFKYALKGKVIASRKHEQTPNIHGPHIVEQMNNIPEMAVDLVEINNMCPTYQSQATICRFNVFWPKPVDIFQWIFMTWTVNCHIHLFSKGFFIGKFESSKIIDQALHEGPWF